MENNYYSKYLKYKQKYIALKAQLGGELKKYEQLFEMSENVATCGIYEIFSKKKLYCNCQIFIPENCNQEDMNTKCNVCSHSKDSHNGLRINPLQKKWICAKQTQYIPKATSSPKAASPPKATSSPKAAPLEDGKLTYYLNKIDLDDQRNCSYYKEHKENIKKYCNCPGFFPYCGIPDKESDKIDDNKQCIFCGHTYNQHVKISYINATKKLCQ